jgi:hypothetical protein
MYRPYQSSNNTNHSSQHNNHNHSCQIIISSSVTSRSIMAQYITSRGAFNLLLHMLHMHHQCLNSNSSTPNNSQNNNHMESSLSHRICLIRISISISNISSISIRTSTSTSSIRIRPADYKSLQARLILVSHHSQHSNRPMDFQLRLHISSRNNLNRPITSLLTTTTTPTQTPPGRVRTGHPTTTIRTFVLTTSKQPNSGIKSRTVALILMSLISLLVLNRLSLL